MCVVFKVFPTRRQRPRPETRKGDEEEYYEPTARYFLLIVGMVRKKNKRRHKLICITGKTCMINPLTPKI